MTVNATTGSNAELARLWQGLAAQGAPALASASSQPIATAGNDTSTASSVGGGQLGSFRNKIESAITAALKNAPPGSDPNKVVKDTLSSLFQADGKDAAVKAHKGHHHHKGKGTGPVDSQQQDFLATLQANGVSPSQFHSDLQSALGQGSGGNVDVAQLFRSFPPGTGVDAVA